MATTTPGFATPTKQNDACHSGTIDTGRTQRTHKTRNRPFGSGLHPRIARAEAWVEAIMALDTCASLERRAGAVLAYNERTRSRLESDYAASRLSYESFSRNMCALDSVESRLAMELLKNASRVRSEIIPEAQRGYKHAEAA